MYELEVLGDFLHTGALAAGNVWRPTAASGNAELDNDVVAEILRIEIIPPVTGLGVIENLEQVKLFLDGKESPYIFINGTDTNLMCPPSTNTFRRHSNDYNGQIIDAVDFGMPMLDAVKSGAPLLKGICPKFKKDLKISAAAGVGGITADFRVRLWGYRYETDQLTNLLGNTIGGTVEVNDTRTQRTLSFFKTPVAIVKENWTQLPGGLDQAVPKINPTLRYGVNAVATTANIPYQMRFDNGQVTLEEENMRFEYDRFDNALLVQRIGVRAPANLLNTFLNIDGKDHPDTRWNTTQFLNDLHFGAPQPILPAGSMLYFPLYTIDKPYLIWTQIGYVAILDNGTPVPIGGVTAALFGTLIEDLVS